MFVFCCDVESSLTANQTRRMITKSTNAAEANASETQIVRSHKSRNSESLEAEHLAGKQFCQHQPQPCDHTIQRQQREKQSVEHRQPQAVKFSRRAADLRDGNPAENCRAEGHSQTEQRQRQTDYQKQSGLLQTAGFPLRYEAQSTTRASPTTTNGRSSTPPRWPCARSAALHS